MYEPGVRNEVKQFLLPLELALKNSQAWSALARLITVATVLQAYEDAMRAAHKQTQLDLFHARLKAGPEVTRDPSKT